MKLRLQHRITTAPTLVHPACSHVPEVAAMFGLGADESWAWTLIPPIELDLQPHRIIFITGPSGSGKSTLLRLIRQAIKAHDDAHEPARAIDFDALSPPPDRPLVDCFGDAPLAEVLRTLSVAGLNDAFVLMRRPTELSDGQRYRLRLAQALLGDVKPEPREGDHRCDALPVILADEFGATLDRLTAAVVSRNVRRWVDRTPACFVAATTHDDLLEPLSPNVLVEKQLGEAIEVAERA